MSANTSNNISPFLIDEIDMDILKKLNRFSLTALAGGVLMTNGCFELPHASAPANEFGKVSPQKYCPGDTVTASYDLAMETACVSRPGFDCATIAPPITISSSPVAFPPYTSTTLIDGKTFAPTEPRVDVIFSPASSPMGIMYPSINAMTGAPQMTSRYIKNTTRTVERLEDEIMQTLTHSGMCSGSTPTHSPAQIADLPEFSPNLSIQQFCNTSAVPIESTLSGAAGEFTRRLNAGECFRLDEPGIPGGLGSARIVGVRSLMVDPTAQCDSLQGMTPPQSLSTRVVLACGN